MCRRAPHSQTLDILCVFPDGIGGVPEMSVTEAKDGSPGLASFAERRAFRRKFAAVLEELIGAYPAALRPDQAQDAERIGFQLEQVFRPGASLADLGGGLGLLSPAAASVGIQAWLVDDFGDPVNQRFPIRELGVHTKMGVGLVDAPVREWGEGFDDASLDVVTCIDSIEHWHHSPRPVFAEAMRVLKPGGVLFIGGPNAVNLRKRISVPLGRSNWSHFEDWYDSDEFRGHVREPVVGDLTRILDDLDFELAGVWGRNWAGYLGGLVPAPLMRVIDHALRPFPTLCSDIYVAGRKPAG
jgi:SAM-dependent methyltransferase